METEFRPYIVIRDKEHLQSLLNNQNIYFENFYTFSDNEISSIEKFKNEVQSLKNFYGFTPKDEDAEYVEELIYHTLVLTYYLQTAKRFSYIYLLIIPLKKEIKANVDLSDITIGRMVHSYTKNQEQYFILLSDEIIRLNDFYTKYFKDIIIIRQKNPEELEDYHLSDFIDMITSILSTMFSIISYNEHRMIKELFIKISSVKLPIFEKLMNDIDCFYDEHIKFYKENTNA